MARPCGRSAASTDGIEQDRRLGEHALATGRTKSDLIRAAAGAAFGIAPYLEDGATYVRKLRDIDRRRAERLEQQWHGDLPDTDREPSAR